MKQYKHLIGYVAIALVCVMLGSALTLTLNPAAQAENTAAPTTVVVDRNGRLVGEPILGSINNEAQMKALQALIDEVLAKDMMTLDKDMMMKPDGN